MSSIFISYNRANEAIVRTLANDFEALGHEVWFDGELSGGQAWWNQILDSVRKCDLFVFALAPQSLQSTACDREYRYAADLGKQILPVMVAEGVSTSLLPPALSAIQIVDYLDEKDRDAAIRLARAVFTIPPPAPLPDPLPEPPAVPISYLGGLAEQVRATSLNMQEQSALVMELKRGLREGENADDARKLLLRLRKRRDLYAYTSEEIDELLVKYPDARPLPPKPEAHRPKQQSVSTEDKKPVAPGNNPPPAQTAEQTPVLREESETEKRASVLQLLKEHRRILLALLVVFAVLGAVFTLFIDSIPTRRGPSIGEVTALSIASLTSVLAFVITVWAGWISRKRRRRGVILSFLGFAAIGYASAAMIENVGGRGDGVFFSLSAIWSVGVIVTGVIVFRSRKSKKEQSG